ncbi:MAG: TetR/AcrR family transcriptional regulator [Candidatus Geothermincolia bacterium]
MKDSVAAMAKRGKTESISPERADAGPVKGPAAGPRSAATKAAILDAAREVFRKHGYRKVTIEDVAQAARVTRQTVYSYFKNKEDLLVVLIEREGTRVVQAGLESAGADQSAVEKLVSLFETVETFVREDDFLQGMVSRDPAVMTPEVAKIVFGFEEKVMDTMAGILEQGMEEGTIRRTDPQLMSYLLVRLHEMFMFAPLGNIEGSDAEKIDAFLVDSVIHLLSPPD